MSGLSSTMFGAFRRRALAVGAVVELRRVSEARGLDHNSVER